MRFLSLLALLWLWFPPLANAISEASAQGADVTVPGADAPVVPGNQIDEGRWAIYLGAPEETPALPPSAPAAYWWWLVILYMFYVMAAVCDEYLVPAIDVICERFSIPEDVAGATLMAFACNGPETLTNVCAIFITHSSVGMGTIVGSAIFNVFVIVGFCAIASDDGVLIVPKITFLRDAAFSGISIVLIWWALPNIDALRASVLLGMAFVYTLVVAKSAAWFGSGSGESEPLALPLLETETTNDNESGSSPGSPVSPATKQKRKLVKRAGSMVVKDTCTDDAQKLKLNSFVRRNSFPLHAESDRQIWRNRKATPEEACGYGPKNRAELWEEYLTTLSAPEETKGICARVLDKIIFALTFPTDILLKATIPDIKRAEKKRYYVAAFLISMFWLTSTSFVVCLGSDAIHKYWGIPQSFLGLTLVSIGTSFPNLWASILTARQGRGPIAVSNAVGSNVQNIFLVLAGPIWAKVMLDGTYVMGGSDIMSSILWMAVSLSTVVIVIAALGWRLTTPVGSLFCAVYVAYVIQTTLSE